MKIKIFSGVLAGILSATLFGVWAQSGSGVQGGGGGGGATPGGSNYATQYKNGTALGGAGPGSSGQVLTSNGAGSAPTFESVSGTGTVTSVALTMPTGFSVANSPITGSGTLAVTFTSGQTANRFLATPNGTTGALSLRAIVAGDLPAISLTTGVSGILPGANGGTNNGFMAFTGPTTSLKTFTLPNATSTILTTNAAVTVAQGGTGVATLTGIVKGSGTSAFSAAASADVISLWSGTCSSATYLRGDGSCNAPSGSGTVTSVGLTMPGVFSVGSSPVTGSGTIAVTANGTSGGVPYFNAASTMASSAALASGQVVLGGGAGSAPATLAAGTSGQILTSNGSSAASWESGVGIADLPSSAGVSSTDLFLVHDVSDDQDQQATAAQVGTAVLGNGFTAFTGPSSSLKTFTLPNASVAILTTNAAVTVAQGGTGAATLTGLLVGNGTSAFTAVTAPSGTVVGTSDTQTLTNKRINPRVQTAANATSVTPTGDSADQTNQANTQSGGTLTMNAPTGTPVDGQKWTFRIKSTNVQTYSWNSIYRGSTAAALPTASSGSSLTDYYGFIYNAADTKWDFVSTVAGF